MTQKEKKELILKKISEGDIRSFNEIQADIELDIWRQTKSLPSFNRFSMPKNNRKRTRGRIIQSVPVLDDSPEAYDRCRVIKHKQVRHQIPIN